MNKRLVALILLAATAFSAVVVTDVFVIVARPLAPWFAWMLP